MTTSLRWTILFCCAVAACDPPEADRARAGDIIVLGGYAYTPVGTEAAAYVSLHNTGRMEDTLLSLGSPLADTVTLHDSRQEGGVVRMVQLDQLVMPPGLVVEMAPGGLHLMLSRLRVAMLAGKKLPLRLQFARAGMIEFDVPIVRYGEPH